MGTEPGLSVPGGHAPSCPAPEESDTQTAHGGHDGAKTSRPAEPGSSGERPPVDDDANRLTWLPLLLQTTDAGFPTGAYAHSFGFEEAVRLGLVRDEATLGDFQREHVAPALAHFELPYLRFAWTAVTAAGDDAAAEIAALDAEVGAGKLARETREGSVTLGIRRLRALRGLHPEDARLAALAADIGAGRVAGHHVIVCAFGAVAGGVPLRAALLAYFYGSVAGICTAAPKLLRIGAEGCQRVLGAAGRGAEAAIAHSLGVAREEAGWFDPLWEIASMRHERAGERLFIS